MKYRVACALCAGHIEFEEAHEGRTTTCPHCNKEIILRSNCEEPLLPDQVALEAKSAWNAITGVFFNKEQKLLEQTQHVEQRRNRIAATMAQVRNGTWKVEVQSVVLQTGERALWRQAAAQVDPSRIGQPEQGGTLGITTKIFKSITTRLTQRPSQSGTTTAAVRGELIVTNYRLIFTGGQKTFITRIENAVNLHSALDGIRYSEKGKSTIYALKYDQPNGDIISEMIQFGLTAAQGGAKGIGSYPATMAARPAGR